MTRRRDTPPGRTPRGPPQDVRRGSAFAAAATAAVVATFATGCASTNFCEAAGSGPTAADAAAMFVARCGANYVIDRGPLDGDKAASGYTSYAGLAEFEISVKDNDEGSLGFLLVGRETARSLWRTLGTLGTGP